MLDVSCDSFNQLLSQCMHMNEAVECHDAEHLCYWRPLDSTTTFIGSANASCRTMDNFDHVCDAVKSSSMSDKLTSSPSKHRHCHISPREVRSTNTGACAASSDVQLWWNFGDAEHYAHSFRNVPVHSRPTDRYQHGCAQHSCADVQSSDELHNISVDNLNTAKSYFPATENVTSCSYGDEVFPVSHSCHCASSCLVESSAVGCHDMNSVRTARPYYHSLATHEQPLFTNSQTIDFNSFNIYHEQNHSALSVRQSTPMNELDDVDLPLYSASTESSSLLAETGANNISEAKQSSFLHDVGCVSSTKPDSLFSHLQKEEQGKHNIDDCEFVWHAAAKIKEKRSESDLQNCSAEAETSIRSPSFCPKLPLSGRRSKKKVQRASDEKLRPAVAQKIVHDDCHNLPAYSGAIENNVCSSMSECVHRTTHLNAKSDMDLGVTANGIVKNTRCKERSKSEDVDAGDCSAAVQSEPSSADPVDTNKPSRVAGSQFCVESGPKVETSSGVRHHRRPLRRTSRAAPKQKSARNSPCEQHYAMTHFRIKRYLESVDWLKVHENIGLFFTVFPFYCVISRAG